MLVPFVDDPTVVQGFKRIPFLLIHWNKYFLVHHLHAPPFPLDKDVLKNVIALYTPVSFISFSSRSYE